MYQAISVEYEKLHTGSYVKILLNYKQAELPN